LGLATIFYCLTFETSLFVASYDSQGHGGGIRSRLHTGMNWTILCSLLITSLHGPYRKHTVSTVVANCCIIKNLLPTNENVFTELLSRNGRCLHSHCLATGLHTTIFTLFNILQVVITFALSATWHEWILIQHWRKIGQTDVYHLAVSLVNIVRVKFHNKREEQFHSITGAHFSIKVA
jgi:hypothetical protein